MTEPDRAFRLASAVERNQENPEGFPIPTRAERESIKRGGLAKLIFQPGTAAHGDESAERMFVKVVEVVEGRYIGRLVNEPISLSALAVGDLVEFGPDNVVSFQRLNWLRRKMLTRQMTRPRDPSTRLAGERLVFTKSYVCFHVFNAIGGPNIDDRGARPTLYALVDEDDGDLIFGCGQDDHDVESAEDWKAIHPGHVAQDPDTEGLLRRIARGDMAQRASPTEPWVVQRGVEG